MTRSPHRASLSDSLTLRRPLTPRRSRVCAPATLVALLGLLLGLAVAAPAQAAVSDDRARSTSISGFTAPSTLTPGSTYVARVTVTGGRRVVVLQRLVGAAWRPVARDRSTVTGRTVIRWTAPRQTGRVALRLKVRRTPDLPALTTRPLPLRVVTDRPAAPTVPEVPVPEVPSPDVPTPEIPVPEVVLDPVELEMLTLVNAVRATGHVCNGVAMPPVGPLSADARLSRAALGHAQDMAANDYVSHNSLDGATFGTRIKAAGYPFGNGGENITAGPTTAAAALTSWLDSRGHCENVMSDDVTHLGLGLAADPESYYGTYWVQVFARPL